MAHAFHRKIRSLQKQGQLTDDQLNNWPELKNTVDILITNLSDTQTLLVSAAVKGITLLGSIIALPLPAHDTTYNVEEKMDVDGDPQLFTKSYVARILLKIVKSTSAKAKIREEAAACLGFLAIGDGKYFTKGNLNAFISLLKLVSWSIRTTIQCKNTKSLFLAVKRCCSVYRFGPRNCAYGART